MVHIMNQSSDSRIRPLSWWKSITEAFKLVHDFSSSMISTTTTTHEDDKQVKGFFLLVPCKEEEAPTLIHSDLMRAMHPLHIFDSSIHGGDCMTSGRELSHWDCAHGKVIKFPYGSDIQRICSSMAGMDGYLLELCTLQGVNFGVSTDTPYIFCDPHGHLWLLEDSYNCLGTWD